MKPMNLFLMAVLCLPVATAFAESTWDRPTPALEKPVEMTVHRSPTCGCCGKWIEHMEKQGFVVKDIKEGDMDAIKRRVGLPEALESCHTAEVGGYVIEGHVPAADVKKILRTRPKLLGLSAPGMPAGSPGMEMGGKKDRFAVIAFDKQGNADKFSEYSDY